MMSNLPAPRPGLASDHPQPSQIRNGDEDFEFTASSPTATTVIARIPSPGQTCNPRDDNRSRIRPSHQSLFDESGPVDEEHFLIDKFVEDNPNLRGVVTIADERYAPPNPIPPPPSSPSSESEFTEIRNEDFSFDKFIQVNWTAGFNLTTSVSDESPPPVSPTSVPDFPESGTSQLAGGLEPGRSSLDSRTKTSAQSPPFLELEEIGQSVKMPHPLASSTVKTCDPHDYNRSRTRPSHQSHVEESGPVDFSFDTFVEDNPNLRGVVAERSSLDSRTKTSAQQSPPFLELEEIGQTFKMPHPLASSTAINPYVIGLGRMSEVLRDGARLTKELKDDARSIGWHLQEDPHHCVCGVSRHPPWWGVDRIKDVHDYSFLLDCQDLPLSMDMMVAINNSGSIVVYDVPMAHRNPIKTKAEQVLRFVDVEIGYGDGTCDNIFHYFQPFDRRILMVVSKERVVGIVVAEKILSAHRILWETSGYMELEEHPVSVRVGINRLWVHISMRRRHLATALCRLIGSCFYENETLGVQDYAFNNISDAMVMFAKVFLKTLRPPLYCNLR